MKHRLALGLIVLLVAFCGGARRAQAGLHFCNKAGTHLEVAITYHDPNQGWISVGWFHLEAGQCDAIIPNDLNNRYYYYFAHSADDRMRFSGNVSYCIQTKKFKFTEAAYGGRTDAECAKAGLRREGFEKLDTGDAKDWTVNLVGTPGASPPTQQPAQPLVQPTQPLAPVAAPSASPPAATPQVAQPPARFDPPAKNPGLGEMPQRAAQSPAPAPVPAAPPPQQARQPAPVAPSGGGEACKRYPNLC